MNWTLASHKTLRSLLTARRVSWSAPRRLMVQPRSGGHPLSEPR